MSNVRVLVVDDNPDFLHSIQRFLQHLPGVLVAGTATNGEECLKQIPLVCPNIILLDLALPGIGSLETLKTIKEEHPDIHVIVVTLHNIGAYRKASLDAGADGFINKSELYENLPALIEATAA